MAVGACHQLPFALFSYLLALTLSYSTFYHSIETLGPFGEGAQWSAGVLFLILTYNILVCCFRNAGTIAKDIVTEAEVNNMTSRRKKPARRGKSSSTQIEVDELNHEDNLDTSREVYRPSRRRSTLPVAEEQLSLDEDGGTPMKGFCQQCRIVQEPGSAHCGPCHACVRDHLFHCSLVANCITIKNSRNYMMMGLIATVLCWEMVAINSYVVATHTEWYFQYHLYMSDNDLLLLAGSLLVLLWGCCMSRRMRFLRILTKVPIVATVIHLKYAYDLQLSFASHRAMEIAVTLVLCTLIAPIMLGRMVGILQMGRSERMGVNGTCRVLCRWIVFGVQG